MTLEERIQELWLRLTTETDWTEAQTAIWNEVLGEFA